MAMPDLTLVVYFSDGTGAVRTRATHVECILDRSDIVCDEAPCLRVYVMAGSEPVVYALSKVARFTVA